MWCYAMIRNTIFAQLLMHFKLSKNTILRPVYSLALCCRGPGLNHSHERLYTDWHDSDGVATGIEEANFWPEKPVPLLGVHCVDKHVPGRYRGPEDHIIIRIPYSGSKDGDKGDSKHHGL